MGLIPPISSHNLHLDPGGEVAEGEDGSKDRARAECPPVQAPRPGSADQAAIPPLASRGQQMPGL